LSSHHGVSDTSLQTTPQAPQLMTLGWALRRTALWLGMLFAMVVVGMWLYNAGIDPDEATARPISPESNQTAR